MHNICSTMALIGFTKTSRCVLLVQIHLNTAQRSISQLLLVNKTTITIRFHGPLKCFANLYSKVQGTGFQISVQFSFPGLDDSLIKKLRFKKVRNN